MLVRVLLDPNEVGKKKSIAYHSFLQIKSIRLIRIGVVFYQTQSSSGHATMVIKILQCQISSCNIYIICL